MKREPPKLRPLTLILDENIASDELRLALAPRAAENGATVELLSDYFARGTFDTVWLPEAGARSWIVLTCDVHIRRRPAEREILLAAGVMAFILRGQLNADQISAALVAAMQSICRRARQYRPPLVCHVSKDGHVSVKSGDRRGGKKDKDG